MEVKEDSVIIYSNPHVVDILLVRFLMAGALFFEHLIDWFIFKQELLL